MDYLISSPLIRLVLTIRQHIFKEGTGKAPNGYALCPAHADGNWWNQDSDPTKNYSTLFGLPVKFLFPTDLKYYLDNTPTCHKYIGLFMDFLFYFSDLFVYSYTTL